MYPSPTLQAGLQDTGTKPSIWPTMTLRANRIKDPVWLSWGGQQRGLKDLDYKRTTGNSGEKDQNYRTIHKFNLDSTWRADYSIKSLEPSLWNFSLTTYISSLAVARDAYLNMSFACWPSFCKDPFIKTPGSIAILSAGHWASRLSVGHWHCLWDSLNVCCIIPTIAALFLCPLRQKLPVDALSLILMCP